MYLLPYNIANTNDIKNTIELSDKNLSIRANSSHFSFNFACELFLKYEMTVFNMSFDFLPNIHKKEKAQGENAKINNPITLNASLIPAYLKKLYADKYS